jgi:hypothetical protein
LVVSTLRAMPDIPDRWPFPDQFPQTPLIACPATLLAKLSAMWHQADAHPIHKIGGEPDWIQGDETPECCGQPMIFYGQLGSLGGKYDLIDNGIIYVFICRKCLSTQSVFQFS